MCALVAILLPFCFVHLTFSATESLLQNAFFSAKETKNLDATHDRLGAERRLDGETQKAPDAEGRVHVHFHVLHVLDVHRTRLL